MSLNRYDAGAYDVVVVGAGHAGTEAALATARMGIKTLMITMNLDSIVAMSCNPNIGGTGKGHLVREIDALGGEMGKNIDKTFIQSRMLNTSKGPAVHSLRAQADKKSYHIEMKKVLENQENLTIRQGEVLDFELEDGAVKRIITRSGAVYTCKSAIIATGTYLRAKIFFGEVIYESGPDGMFPSLPLSDSLKKHGFELRRLKTGTPARVHRDSIDFSVMEVQPGDKEIVPFSFMNKASDLEREQVDCYLTYTTEKMHDIIRGNLGRSLMFKGEVNGVGPRYCPSIEDKVTRFSDKEKHQVFIEPEGLDTKEMYVQGISSALPEEVQIKMYKEIIGLEKVEFLRNAYAIEYDAIDATKLKRSLESRDIKNLFFAGQINGSSGYEEAAAQGLIAGINAAQNILGGEALILDRSEAYIGVLIDDIVTKGSDEPYRMMTSRAEYRLTLRQDNADIRLTEKGYALGSVTEERYLRMLKKRENVNQELDRLKTVQVNPTEENNEILVKLGTAAINTPHKLYDLLRRPEVSYDALEILDGDRPSFDRETRLQVETQIKYEGYIKKQMMQIEQFKKLEEKKIPEGLDYHSVNGLCMEARQKLSEIRPESLGQASRITGVSPADMNVLMIWLEQRRRGKKND